MATTRSVLGRVWQAERQTLRGFFLRQRVLEVAPAVVLARLDAAFAGAADAVAAVERDVDPDAVGGVGNRLVRATLDEARDAVLEAERDSVAHRVLVCDAPGSEVVDVDHMVDVVVLQ